MQPWLQFFRVSTTVTLAAVKCVRFCDECGAKEERWRSGFGWRACGYCGYCGFAPELLLRERDSMAMATSAPIRIVGKSWPVMASAVVSERANDPVGAIVLPIVVSVVKL